MKTIDITALEWFDKVNGNSYFAATVTLDFGTDQAQSFKLPYQYGFDQRGLLPNLEHYSHGGTQALWTQCKENGVILRTVKHENCNQKELKNIQTNYLKISEITYLFNGLVFKTEVN